MQNDKNICISEQQKNTTHSGLVSIFTERDGLICYLIMFYLDFFAVPLYISLFLHQCVDVIKAIELYCEIEIYLNFAVNKFPSK